MFVVRPAYRHVHTSFGQTETETVDIVIDANQFDFPEVANKLCFKLTDLCKRLLYAEQPLNNRFGFFRF